MKKIIRLCICLAMLFVAIGAHAQTAADGFTARNGTEETTHQDFAYTGYSKFQKSQRTLRHRGWKGQMRRTDWRMQLSLEKD